LHGIVPSFSNNEIFIIDELSTDSFVVPTEVTLNNAYPNPFNPITNISFSLPIKMHVELNILDIQGKIVKKVLSGTFNQGLNNVQIDGQSLSSGLYFIQLVAGAEVEYSKVLLLK
jgi:flagellar hook assembly protein FlgD